MSGLVDFSRKFSFLITDLYSHDSAWGGPSRSLLMLAVEGAGWRLFSFHICLETEVSDDAVNKVRLRQTDCSIWQPSYLDPEILINAAFVCSGSFAKSSYLNPSRKILFTFSVNSAQLRFIVSSANSSGVRDRTVDLSTICQFAFKTFRVKAGPISIAGPKSLPRTTGSSG